MRGEHGGHLRTDSRRVGSSPHAWGACTGMPGCSTHRRFIPTCVGSIWAQCSPALSKSVHPHMRGEHATRYNARTRIFGSSPHAWGASTPITASANIARFIPTCVGSIRILGGRVNGVTVHPHMRGEHVLHGYCRHGSLGSSPHAWGAWGDGDVEHGLLRFIPTCVGSILRSAGVTRPAPVHPHMRGEHGVAVMLNMVYSGSSPHAWGALALSRR